jgi:2-dehydropantoate 2-reductase
MRIAIMGAGAVGGYFGARLVRGGGDVTFIARGAHFAAMRERGLVVESSLGDIRLPQVKVTDDPKEVGPVDLVIFSVKLWDTEQAARQIEPLVRDGAAVVSLQNGVQKDNVLGRILGPEAIMGGACYISASIAGPGVVLHIGKMERIVFGEYDGSRSLRAEAFLEACRRAAMDVVLTPDVKRAIWEKFVFLVAMSGATSTIRLPIGPIRQDQRTRAFLMDLMREVIAVGCACGVKLNNDLAEARMTACDTLPPDMTSSMHNDLKQGNRLEVPWLGEAEYTWILAMSEKMRSIYFGRLNPTPF